MSAPGPPILSKSNPSQIKPKARNGQITYYWSPPASDGGSPITYYVLSIANYTSFTINAPTTSYTVTGRTNGQDYTGSVAAYNENGEGPSATFRTVQPGFKPDPPTGVSVTLPTSSTALVSWTAPVYTGEATIKWYVVKAVSNNIADPVIKLSAYSYSSQRLVKDLNPASTYTFTVYAVNDPGYSVGGVPMGSYSFNGTSYLSLTTNSNLPLGNNSYTIEAWIKPTSYGGFGITGWGGYSGTNTTNAFRLYDPGLVNYWYSNDLVAAAPYLTDGNWHHVVAQYDGNLRYIYVDGSLRGGDIPGVENTVSVYNNFTVGRTFDVEYFEGKITNLRIVKGVAVYTGNFTVPTSPLTAIQSAGTNINAITAGQTALLLNVNQSSPYADSSSYGYTMTPNGTPTISTDSPF
jgi:hypothetical protein